MEMMKKLGLVALVALLAAAGYIVFMKHQSSANVKIQMNIGKSVDEIADESQAVTIGKPVHKDIDDINAAMITSAKAAVAVAEKALDDAKAAVAAAEKALDDANNSNNFNTSFTQVKINAAKTNKNVAVQNQKDAQEKFDIAQQALNDLTKPKPIVAKK